MPNELLPSNIQFGTVVGRFGSAPLIAGDADGLPDFSPASGLTVTFTPSTAAVIDATATPAPVTIEMVPIVCGLDSQGYLVGGDGQRGVKLIATDDTDINPSGWTYSVTFLRGGQKVAAFRDFSMSLPAGTTKDIALTIPVPSSSGVSLNQAQAAEAAAVAAASAASAAAAASAASAASAGTAATAATVNKVDKGTLVFSVKDEGATGDGTTDDTAAIAAAYTKARAVNGTVLFPAGGTYINGATINPLGTTTNGYGATLKHRPSMTAVNMYQSTGAAKFNGLTIDLNKANTTDPSSLTVGIGIYLFNATSFTGAVIRDVTINNGYAPGLRIATGVTITDGASAPNCDTRVDNYRSNACKYGILATKVGGLSLTGGRVTGAALDGIWVSLADKFSANGVTVTGSTGHGFATSYISDAQFTNNTANSNGQSGIAIGGGTVGNAVSVRFTLTGNTCRGNTQHGITIDPTITGASGVVQPMNSSITGNVCDTNGLYGLYLHNTQYVTVSGNTLTGNARGLSVDGSHTTITANTITGNTVRGISLSGNNTTAPNYGYHEVSGNKVSGNASLDYWVESIYVVETRVSVAGTGDPNGALAVPVGSTYARTDGASGTALYVKEGGGVGNTGWTAMSSSAPRNFDVQTFTANGTWTMPVGCNFVTGVLIGGGGGAASGRRGAAGAIRCAGGAGGGGGITRFSLPASAVTSTVAVTVGAAGVGGAAVTTDDTNGNPGTSGGSSLFGLYARAWGGAFGAGGTATAGTGGAGGNGSTNGQSGASASTTGAAGTSAPSSQGAGGGASGGGITAANTASNGGGGAPAVTVKTGAAAAGGVVDTTAPGAADTSAAGVPLPGGTGGAGASSVTAAAQAGAAGGIYGAGGSSGGASANGNNSGAGGNAAAGIVVIYSY